MYLYKPVFFSVSDTFFFFFFLQEEEENFVLAIYNLALSPLHKTEEGGGKMGNAFLVISSCFCQITC